MKCSQRWRGEIGLKWRFEGIAAKGGGDTRSVERYRQEKSQEWIEVGAESWWLWGARRHAGGEREWMRTIDKGGEGGRRWAEAESRRGEERGERRGGGTERYLHVEIPQRGWGVEGKGGRTERQRADLLTNTLGGTTVSVTQQQICQSGTFFPQMKSPAHCSTHWPSQWGFVPRFPFEWLCEGEFSLKFHTETCTETLCPSQTVPVKNYYD